MFLAVAASAAVWTVTLNPRSRSAIVIAAFGIDAPEVSRTRPSSAAWVISTTVSPRFGSSGTPQAASNFLRTDSSRTN